MPVIAMPHDYDTEDLFVDLRGVLDRPLLLKCEGVNFAGSITLSVAVAMVDAAERDGSLVRGSILVESSSGDLAVSLAVVAAGRGYDFVCVTDPRCDPAVRGLVEALGGRVHTVTEPDARGGFAAARLGHVARLYAADPRHLWLNRYASTENWRTHYRTTGPAILRGVPDLDVLFVGAGTTGPLVGCARYVRAHRPDVRVVAVDAVVPASPGDRPRLVPGLGMIAPPRRPDLSTVHDVVHVTEVDAVLACHRLAAAGYLFGASTGMVVSGALAWLDAHSGERRTAVAVAPDTGSRCLDTVYDPSWVAEHVGEGLVHPTAILGGPARAVAGPWSDDLTEVVR